MKRRTLIAVGAAFCCLSISANVRGQFTAYVSTNDQTIVAIQTEDLSVETYPAAGTRAGLALSPDGRILYSPSRGTVIAIDLTTRSELANFRPGQGADYAAVPSEGEKVYLAGGRTLTIIDAESFDVLKEVPLLADGATELDFTPDDRFLYVSLSNSGIVSKIDTETDTVVADLSDVGLVGAAPDGIVATPDTKFVYVAMNSSELVAKIDVQTDEIIKAFAGPWPNLTKLTIAPDGSKLYVTGTDSMVSVVHVGPDTLMKVINVQDVNHRGMDITPDGKLLFITNLNDMSVSVVDAEADTFLTKIDVGNVTWDVVVGPTVEGGDPTASEAVDLPQENLHLRSNRPNPFSGGTTISYETVHSGQLRLEVFDVQGRRIRTLVHHASVLGQHEVWWDGRDDTRNDVPAGVYLVRLRSERAADTRLVTKVH